LAAVPPALIGGRIARRLLAATLWVSVACGLPATAIGAGSEVPDVADSALDVRALDSSVVDPTVAALATGSLDRRFTSANTLAGKAAKQVWLKLDSAQSSARSGIPVVVMHAARQTHADLYAARAGSLVALPNATQLPAFRGTQDSVFALLEGFTTGQPVYAHVQFEGGDSRAVKFSTSTLDRILARGAAHARMIALAFGAQMAMALSALLIWFVLSDSIFLLYATLFFLQALYVAYLSGQGFDWPVLSYARPLTSFAWNVPVSLSGAVACLFTREIADLRRFSPRIYTIFGWFAVAFVIVTFANVAKFVGFGVWVNLLGNSIFLAAAVFTLVVSFLAWRRGNRAAGWFLIAWGLLEGFTITAALRFLFTGSEDSSPLLYYYGLPLSMVAAGVLIALGVADRLRAQRVALSDAERRAQTDPLTGVLNRRSLIERLDAACLRARARGLPIALLFIDLDHFKQINDSFGHQAGDACLRAIIEPIHAELRQSDVIGRYGGEEFVVILSSADSAAADPIAHRILERVAAVRVEGYGKSIGVTCSIGVAASDVLGVWGEHLIAYADAAVYVAKRSGRNQVQMAAPRAA
jgi:two-component system, sensor histidine kinase LadS